MFYIIICLFQTEVEKEESYWQLYPKREYF